MSPRDLMLEAFLIRQNAKTCAIEILDKIDSALRNYLENDIFSDESTVSTSGTVNRHNFRIWDSEQPNVIREHVGKLKSECVVV
ncbi:hypothetical protein CEXT_434921 [Caerostris extrusa]|uniref:Uncharacterized protein n=1 Tax=Caerostris extrusa TaxID=172846 RepID=A0AAV4UDZ1_CAEEX|nr:hypothetical protein CEXT_434921 [Caerostris extrusa]